MDAKTLGCDPQLIQDMDSLFASSSDWIVLIAHKVCWHDFMAVQGLSWTERVQGRQFQVFI